MINISVVVPAFKRIPQTLRTLDLLLLSEGLGTNFNLELIVADSTPDDSLKDAVSARFGQKVLYVKPEKEGIAANKNAGAKAAHNPILIFSDSDIEPESSVLQEAINALQLNPKAAAVGGTVLWRGGPHDGEKDRPRIEDRMMISGNTTYIEALYSRFLATYKDVFIAVGGYDDNVFNMRGEGSDLSCRYWRTGYPLIYSEAIVVHHVHDVTDAAAVRVPHPEWGIAKDLLLLGYKYDIFETPACAGRDFKNFPATVDINFSLLGAEGYYRMLQGIGRHYEDLIAAKPYLDAYRAADKPAYDFKFLEVFSNPEMFQQCIDEALSKLALVRDAIFPGPVNPATTAV
jgi:glycosyltransferase involved in cell wall biosynthesis